ncbi:NADH dehydrogenase [ubiquinone] flavoprotein 3, mitochondrial isoform X1 [Pteronotus mesoamericanus]|uniref:NADH dehydrogenase [ubiquinone] flavoprotein 3, mitochondrial isoform X1 n=1 Tax=Pteronotus mesoamericanus TaxID=1884717 RepID=UPI0023EDACA5|nr:NADH dehydrogenase [ubiquinone] flavoprotein 3, mitochondrial isoform X1 [Pteronotus parnellii mesoamericanus]
MAAFLLFRQGRARALKTVLLEGQVFRGLAPTASLSAESGKSDKGLPPSSKKQSSPKNVVDPKERGKPLTTPRAAELSKKLTSPSSYSSVVKQGGTVASPNADGSGLFTDEGVPKPLSRKTLVEFPQKVPSSFREQGIYSEALATSGRMTDSSSSSSSSSSDSESDEEGGGSEIGSPVASRVTGRVPKPEASPPFENRAPKISVSAREKAWSPQPRQDLPSAEGPRQAKKGASIKPLKVGKDEPKPAAPKSQIDEEFMKQNVKGKKRQEIFSSNKIKKESQKPFEVTDISSDHTKSGSSTQPSGAPVPPRLTEETAAGRQLQATPETRGRQLEKQVPETSGEVAFSPFRKENLGKQVIEGISKANEEILEDQERITSLKPVPVHNKDFFDEKTAALKLEAKGEIVEDSAAQAGDQDGTQEPTQATAPTQAAAPPEPFDNTTYKNLQHHDYTAYTFLDLNLDLSRFRMPQPSSGRESPRH